MEEAYRKPKKASRELEALAAATEPSISVATAALAGTSVSYLYIF